MWAKSRKTMKNSSPVPQRPAGECPSLPLHLYRKTLQTDGTTYDSTLYIVVTMRPSSRDCGSLNYITSPLKKVMGPRPCGQPPCVGPALAGRPRAEPALQFVRIPQVFCLLCVYLCAHPRAPGAFRRLP